MCDSVKSHITSAIAKFKFDELFGKVPATGHSIPSTAECPKDVSEVCFGFIGERSIAQALQQNNQPEGSTREPLNPFSDNSCPEKSSQVKIVVSSAEHATLPVKEVPPQDPAMLPRKEVPVEDPSMFFGTEVPSEDPQMLSDHLHGPDSTSGVKRSRKKNKRGRYFKKKRTNE